METFNKRRRVVEGPPIDEAIDLRVALRAKDRERGIQRRLSNPTRYLNLPVAEEVVQILEDTQMDSESPL